ncbi:uncharacterized protein LOC113993938 [Pipra filicauda]|uniref:Uncharacterized protein LOC113993938 n=1 Tax=Pipra filicauda TaxID=649802 RepID=A0A6J2HLM7_9PASS|nr:uncharacterized protein LOC113993938 [Pipra filicauda]
MAHRLRFHFGSGRSHTAPESEILEREREDDFFLAFHTLPRRSGPHACSRRGAAGDLKRSTSMFIPQLLAGAEARPTRSSSVQISLQRKGADGEGEEAGPCQPSALGERCCAAPPENRPAAPGSPHSSAPGSGQRANGTVCCNRRVFCAVPSNSQSKEAPAAARREEANEAPSGLNISGVRIQHRASSADVPQVTLLPLGSEAPGNAAPPEPRRWSLQHVPDPSASSGKKFFVLQLQQPQASGAGAGGGGNFGFTGTKGDRLVRYPRIRLERSTSYPVQPPAEGIGPPADGPGSEPPGNGRSRSEVSGSDSVERIPQGQGCLFKIRPEQKTRQQHFRILVTRGPDEQSQGVGTDGPGAAVSPGCAVPGRACAGTFCLCQDRAPNGLCF